MARVSAIGNPLAEEIKGSSSSAPQNSDIVWSSDARSGRNQLKHYTSFSKNLIEISAFSFVRVIDGDKKPSLGYVEDLFEDTTGEKMVRLRQFVFAENIEALIPDLKPRTREVFITSNTLEISAKFIDSPVAILAPRHFNRDLILTLKSFVCLRKFKNRSVTTFSVSGLRGYYDQPIISALENRVHRQPSRGKERETAEPRPIVIALECAQVSEMRNQARRGKKTKEILKAEVAKKGNGKSVAPVSKVLPEGSNRNEINVKSVAPVSQVLPEGNQKDIDLNSVAPVSQVLPEGNNQNGFNLNSVAPVSQVLPEGNNQIDINVKSMAPTGTQVLPEGNKNDVHVEVLCQDSGMRGCWFRCKILRSTQKNLKVQHCDVIEVDGPGKLEEWVVKSRVANPDKLGIRSGGRLTVRPWPQSDSSELKLGMGVAVDAWWSDGWWEGVITGYDMSSNDNLQVYSPGENKFLIVGKKDVRVSKDWVNGQWVDVKAKPDIFSFLNSYLNPLPKVKLPDINNSPPSSSEASKKRLDELRLEQLKKLKEKEDWTVRGSGNAAKKGKMENLPARPPDGSTSNTVVETGIRISNPIA